MEIPSSYVFSVLVCKAVRAVFREMARKNHGRSQICDLLIFPNRHNVKTRTGLGRLPPPWAYTKVRVKRRIFDHDWPWSGDSIWWESLPPRLFSALPPSHVSLLLLWLGRVQIFHYLLKEEWKPETDTDTDTDRQRGADFS